MALQEEHDWHIADAAQLDNLVPVFGLLDNDGSLSLDKDEVAARCSAPYVYTQAATQFDCFCSS